MDASARQDFEHFTASSEALRAHYGEGSLVVKPQLAGDLAIGGWAFLDGAPAVLPAGLDIIVVVVEGPTSLPRDAAGVELILGPYLEHVSEPVPHIVARIPERAFRSASGARSWRGSEPSRKRTPIGTSRRWVRASRTSSRC